MTDFKIKSAYDDLKNKVVLYQIYNVIDSCFPEGDLRSSILSNPLFSKLVGTDYIQVMDYIVYAFERFGFMKFDLFFYFSRKMNFQVIKFQRLVSLCDSQGLLTREFVESCYAEIKQLNNNCIDVTSTCAKLLALYSGVGNLDQLLIELFKGSGRDEDELRTLFENKVKYVLLTQPVSAGSFSKNLMFVMKEIANEK